MPIAPFLVSKAQVGVLLSAQALAGKGGGETERRSFPQHAWKASIPYDSYVLGSCNST